MTTKMAGKPKPVPKQTIDFGEERLKALKEVVPDAFSEGKFDLEKLKNLLGTTVQEGTERYFFTWAGKKEAVLTLQKPSSAALVPDRKESVDFDKTKNIFIEGENLEVLKLLYKSYFGRVKLIYIDPQYNTGKDFIYPDNYTEPLEFYLEMTGQITSDGNLLTSNPQTSGRYHSSWLSMVYPRLFFARQLLCEEGVIFVSIDDNEVYHLRLLMNEIYGEENFLAQLCRRTKAGGGSAASDFAVEHDYVLIYAKNKAALPALFAEHNPDYITRYNESDEKGRYFWDTFERSYTKTRPYIIQAPDGSPLDGKWFRSEDRFKKDVAEGEIRFVKKKDGTWSVQFKQRMAEGRKLRSMLHEKEFISSQADLERLGMKDCFPFPKPVHLLKTLLQLGDSDDLVIDFWAGSCTTAQAVLELNRDDGGNRHFIMVQLPEPLPEPKKLDEGPTLHTIADIGRERIRRVIKQLRAKNQAKLSVKLQEEDLGFRAFKLTLSNYGEWLPKQQTTIREYTERMAKTIDSLRPGWKAEDVIYEIALKEGYSLAISMEKVDLKSAKVFKVIDLDTQQYFYVTLDEKVHISTLKPLNLMKGDLFICRDIALDDTTAANLALQCRLKTV